MNGRDKRQKRAARAAAMKPNLRTCLNCGQPGSHFVPPSFGESGFFACRPKVPGAPFGDDRRRHR